MRSLLLVGALLICTLGVLCAQGPDFQMGKIVAVEKIAPNATAGGTDAPTVANRQAFNFSIEHGDTRYVCRAETGTDFDLDWAQGKEVPVKVKGKTMLVKRANGKVVKFAIVSTKKLG